ncbi:hypothetical protein [Actinacidiphila bryophytorum]|uniref:hypothetical protein n=1 Tax=Actinacidiphila bryophytorum TaxID=1436133 RepID=UPI0019602654|nr:hypothetical protein [Actinacidiphila bryophytorum]MBM9438112.1 hypothetical protein [Actinacidiphila bryophytorum]
MGITDDAVVAGTPAPEPKAGARHTGWLTLPLAEPSARAARLHTRTALRQWRIVGTPDDTAESGRGLNIVAGMCRRHGCALAHDHKIMWAALALLGTAL